MIKGFRQIVALTAFSRVLGMVRDMAFAYFLGSGGLMDGWAIAFKIPNLARRLFGEGAASASLIPVYSRQLHENPHDARRLARTVVTVVFVLLAALVVTMEGGIWAWRHFFDTSHGGNTKLSLTAVMLPYMIMICTVAILGGILNTHGHFAAPAAAPIVLNMFIISSLCLAGCVFKLMPTGQVYVVAFSVLAAGCVQLLLQLPALRTLGISIKPAWAVRSQAFKDIMVMMAPMVLGLTATQINTLADDLIGLWLSGSGEKGAFFYCFGMKVSYPLWEGTVSRLYYAQRLYQFPLGVLGLSLATAIFPVMSAEAARKDLKSLAATTGRGLKAAIFVAMPATAGLLVVAMPLVSAVFGHGRFNENGLDNTGATAAILCMYALGLCGFFAQQILARALYSLQDPHTPAKSAAIAVVVNIALNMTLVWPMGASGLAISTTLCSYVQVVLLLRAIRKKLGPALLEGAAANLGKTAIATSACWVTGAVVKNLTEGIGSGKFADIAILAAVVVSSAMVYAAAAMILKIDTFYQIIGAERARK